MTKNMNLRTVESMKEKLKSSHVDLMNSIKKNYALKIGATILWYIIAFISLTRYFDSNGTINHLIAYIALLLVIILLPFYLFKTHRIFFDTTWKGTVSKVEKKTDSIRRSAFLDVANTYIEYEIVYITHEFNKNKKWKMRFKKSNSNSNPMGYYKQGDEVIHYKGLNFCEKLYKRHDRHVICLNCGNLNPPTQGKCKKCKNSVVI